MNDQPASTFAQKWPVEYPERIQLYSLPTPNGVKVSIMLEESALAYEPHLVNFESAEQKSAEFLALNENGKIPTIVDPRGPAGGAITLSESGAILIYLADKAQRLLPPGGAARYETIQWLMFQMSAVGPMFGQLGFFHKFAGKDFEDKRPLQRYVAESKRLLSVLDHRLQKRAWIMGNDYSIADIATFPWINTLATFYNAGELVGLAGYPHVARVLAAFMARPAVARGLTIPKRHSS